MLAAAIIGSSVVGAVGASSAASKQEKAANQATNAQLEMFHETQKNLAPFVGAGPNALANLTAGIGSPSQPGPFSAPFNPQNLANTPGYQFALQQGEQAITDQASATGGIGGGNTLKALMSYGTGLASQTYQQQFEDYLAQQQNAFQQAYNLASLSENAAAGQGSIAEQTGANIANTITGAGNAAAAGTVGATNAITGGIGNLSSNFLLSSLLSGGGASPFVTAGGGSFGASLASGAAADLTATPVPF